MAERASSGDVELRAFVAIELPSEILAALGEIQADLSARAVRAGVDRGIRWVNPSGVHLTLKFLGATPAGLVPEIERRLVEALTGQSSFSLGLDEVGVFPNPRAPRVLWVGLGGDLERLAATQSLVEAAIAPLGFPTESRPFSPHLTLARVSDWVQSTDRQLIGGIVRDARPRRGGRFAVTEVSLMRSELRRGGASYSRLGVAALEKSTFT